MAAHRPLKKATKITQEHPHPLVALDRLCSAFCRILCDRGVPYPHAARVVASWVRPETRRRRYGDPLRSFREAARPHRHRPTTGREANLSGPGTLTHLHKQGKVRDGYPQGPSNTPKHNSTEHQAPTWRPRAATERRAEARATDTPHQATGGTGLAEAVQTLQTPSASLPSSGIG
ncbi:Hypothetical predicted protein [Pelobates cultripes]|uniref:Uncharacterized protein n=1 Tax=Pelobates cultripes TaxID=61616 RepID=A0AAD1W3G4_PELCU|nr:Hypothetical predicted protein [Pelobates cultripes]